MYKLQLFKSAQWEELLYICGNRINLVYDSELHASSQSSSIQKKQLKKKLKQINKKNSYIHLPYQNTKYNFPDCNPYNLLMTYFYQ